MYMMPLVSVYIAFIMPAALGIYWIAQSVFSLIQEVVLGKFFTKKLQEEEDARYAPVRRTVSADGGSQGPAGAAPPAGGAEAVLKEKRKAAQEAKVQKAKKAGTSTTEAGRVGSVPMPAAGLTRPTAMTDN